jgi:hypothetical protein
LGQQVKEEKGLNGSSQNTSRTGFKKVVQGGLERCPLREALWKTEGRKARNAILQTIQTCEFKDSCYCIRDVQKRKAFTYFTEKKVRATRRETP